MLFRGLQWAALEKGVEKKARRGVLLFVDFNDLSRFIHGMHDVFASSGLLYFLEYGWSSRKGTLWMDIRLSRWDCLHLGNCVLVLYRFW